MNEDNADLNKTFTDKVVDAVVDTAKDVVGGVDREVRLLIEDDSDESVRQLASKFGGSSMFSGKVFDALDVNGGEIAMAQISEVIKEKSNMSVCDDDLKQLSMMVNQALNIWERNGNDAAMRGVYEVMKDPNSDSHLFNTCQHIIENTGNVAVQEDMQALLDNKLPETFEDAPVALTNEL